MLKLLKRYVKFMGTSVAGTLVDTSVLWILSDFVFTKGYWGEYFISPIISFQCAVTVNFIVSYFYVWRDRTHGRPDAGKKRIFRLFALYDLSASAVFLLRFGVLQLIGRVTGWDVVLCNLLAMCVSGIINFMVENLLIFRKGKAA